MTRFEAKTSPLRFFAIAISLCVVFTVDVLTPLGYAEWVFYCLPVALSLATSRPVMPLVVAGVATLLTVIGFDTSSADVDPALARVNRIFGVSTVWVLGFFGWFFIRGRLELREQAWLQQGQTMLNALISGEQSLADLGGAILRFFTGYLDAQSGAMYVEERGLSVVSRSGACLLPAWFPDSLRPAKV